MYGDCCESSPVSVAKPQSNCTSCKAGKRNVCLTETCCPECVANYQAGLECFYNERNKETKENMQLFINMGIVSESANESEGVLLLEDFYCDASGVSTECEEPETAVTRSGEEVKVADKGTEDAASETPISSAMNRFSFVSCVLALLWSVTGW